MPISFRLVRRSIRVASAISPALAARLELKAFFTTTPRMPLREVDTPTDLAAQRDDLSVRGKNVVIYEWGHGERTILLVHGWQGRATQFAPLVRELAAQGFRVVSFDAPAHGASAGRRTDLRDWLEIIGRLQTQYGSFHAIIGHSLGAIAALTAAKTITPTGAVAAVAGAASPTAMLAEFSRQLGVDSATHTQAERLLYARFGESEASFIAHYDAAADPLPSTTELLVIHDRSDHRMPDADSLRLHQAHGDRSRLLRTSGLGHNRVLVGDQVLDALVAFVTVAADRLNANDAMRHSHGHRWQVR